MIFNFSLASNGVSKMWSDSFAFEIYYFSKEGRLFSLSLELRNLTRLFLICPYQDTIKSQNVKKVEISTKW